MSLPAGYRLRPDTQTRRLDRGRVLVGGSPRRVLRLTDRGAALAGRLLDGAAVDSDVSAALARRLLDGGLAHPLPPASSPLSWAVVIPVYDDVDGLSSCLPALRDAPVVVVDDGSTQRDAIASIVARHDARLIRLDDNRGPATARNAGLAATGADVVVFVDSDAVVSPAQLATMTTHFADPAVVAVAPRVRPAAQGGSWLTRFAESMSPLDLGAAPSPVGPGRRVPYVPSTVLAVRRTAIEDVGGFDVDLRYGEDVDLVWRLTRASGCIRYEPAVQVDHREPQQWSSWLRRRYRYGTSAAQLSRRHPDATIPLRVPPAAAAAVALFASGHRRLAITVAVGTALRLRRRLGDVPPARRDVTVGALIAPATAALAAARWLTQLWWPATVAATTSSKRARRLVPVMAVAAPLVEWAVRRPRLDPLRWSLAMLADDVAYGAGVWRGCLRARTLRPLLPAVTPRTSSRNATAAR